MARSKKPETQATTAEAGMTMILNSPVEKSIEEAAKVVGVAEIRLLEMFSERLELPEAMGWETVPIEHEALLTEFKQQQDAFNSVRALEPEKEVVASAPTTEMPVAPPIMEDEPQPQGELAQAKQPATELTRKRKDSIDKTSKTSKKLGKGLDEAEFLVEAQKGRKKGAKKAAVRLVAEEETYNEILTKAAIQRLADELGETEEEEEFDPLAYARQSGSQDVDETLKIAMEKIAPVLGKLEEAANEVVDNSYSNGSKLDLSRLEKLMRSTD